MKNKSLFGLTGRVVFLAVIAMVMNASWKFAAASCLGMVLMWAISYVDYRKIGENFFLPWFLMGGTMGIHIGRAVGTCLSARHLIPVFFSREGDAAYIYHVVEDILEKSKWIGRGVMESELQYLLPLHTKSSILVSYIGSYGWCVGCLVIAVLTWLFVKIIIDIRKMSTTGKVINTGCIVILGMEFILTTLKNLLCIPYIRYSTFLPLFSQGRKELIFTYVLLGLILSVYRFEQWEKK